MENLFKIVFILLIISALSCQDKVVKEVEAEIEITKALPKDFEEINQVNLEIAEGLTLDLWAPGPLLANAVALTFDNQGVAYVTETARRKSSDIDIRQHPDWMVDDLASQNLGDTKKLHLEKLATELSDQNTWLEDFNQDSLHDYRDLMVQSERIRKIWDSDGDGRADAAQIYANGFNEMLTGVAAGVLHHDGAIFMTAAPDVYRITDNNEDGIGNIKEVIRHGFGIHVAFAGHDMSGLTTGMDGKIYWSIGDLGVNTTGADGKQWAYPNQGAVMRCNPDGSDFEVFAHGLRNPQEIAFDNYGNLISVDNDGDHPGEHERYVHIIEGSDSGWRINWQYGKYNQPNESYKVWMDEGLYLPYFSGQAAYLLPALKTAYDGPAGLAFNPGTALGPAWKDYFFASYFKGSSARSKIQAFKIAPKGASFEIIEEKDVVGGIVPTGITFGPDGALYINDWKDSYAKKQSGRIWKLDSKDIDYQKIRKETSQLLKVGMSNKSLVDLEKLMGHEDQRVRLAAQFELVKRKAISNLTNIAQNNPTQLARLHAIWGIGQIARKESTALEPIINLLKDKNGTIRAQTAKVIGDAQYQPAATSLLIQLNDSHPSAQFFAAEALGKLTQPSAFQPLVNLLATTGEKDPHLRHAIILALSRINQPKALGILSKHSSKFVRIGAVVALRMLKSDEIINFLGDIEPLVVVEAARGIHDDFSIPAALPALAAALAATNSSDEAFTRRAINANLRLGKADNAKRLATYALSDEHPTAMRADALWALGYWDAPPVLDRVEGRYRKLSGHQLGDAQAAFTNLFSALSAQSNLDLKIGAITAAGRLKYQAAAPTLVAMIENTATNLALKKASITALAQLDSPDLERVLKVVLTDKEEELRLVAQDLLPKTNLTEMALIRLYNTILNQNTLAEKQQALASLSAFKTPEAEEILTDWWDKFETQQIALELQLDLLTAIEASPFAALKAKKIAYEKTINAEDSLEVFQSTLFGGNVEKGKTIFRKNEAAQCMRCHQLKGKGGAVGPKLDRIASLLSRTELLAALVAPNERLAPGYGTVILKLTNGEAPSGIVLKETTEALILKTNQSANLSIKKSEIERREDLPSGMFNISGLLDKAQIRDLMAYLVTLK